VFRGRLVVTIAALIAAGWRDDLSRELAPVGGVEWCDGANALVARASAPDVDVVVTSFDGFGDGHTQSVAPAVVAISARRPKLPIVLYDRIDGGTLPKLLALFTTGLRMTCAVHPHESLAPVVRHVLSPSFLPPVTPVLLQRFVPYAPAGLALFVAMAALVAHSHRAVAEVARWNGTSPRTIERRLSRAGWRGAHVVLQSFAALDAVWLMTEYGWSAHHVQEVRGFSHGSAVTRLLVRYAGVHPGTLREDGGFAAALEHVTEALSADGER
jgi:hypothetical protein